MSNDDAPKIETPEIPDRLKDILSKDSENVEQTQLIRLTPKGFCRNHGEVGFARLVLYDVRLDGQPTQIISEHCMWCVSNLLKATIGTLEVLEDEPKSEPVQTTREEAIAQGADPEKDPE